MTTMSRLVQSQTNFARIKLALAIAAVMAAAGLSACNTTEGFGKDVKAAGQGLEDSANRHK